MSFDGAIKRAASVADARVVRARRPYITGLACVLALIVQLAAWAAPASAAPIVREADVQYVVRNHVPLAYDVIRVDDGVARRPIVVLLHGGGWWRGERSDLIDSRPIAQAIARAGFVVVVPEYRLACGTPAAPRRVFGISFAGGAPRCGATLAAQVADVQQAVRHARANAVRFRGDPARVALFGMSAGGHIALLAALRAPAGEEVRAVVNVSGPPTTGFIRRQLPRPPRPARSIRASFTNAVGCHPPSCLGRWRAADPMLYLNARRSPFDVLGIAGASEGQVPVAVMRAFDRRADRLGWRSELVIGRGGCHGAGCLHAPALGSRERVLAGTLRFLHSSLGDPLS